MAFLPFFFEILKLFAVGFPSIVSLIVFFDFGNCFKLLDDLLIVTPALCGASVMQIFFKGFKYFGCSE